MGTRFLKTGPGQAAEAVLASRARAWRWLAKRCAAQGLLAAAIGTLVSAGTTAAQAQGSPTAAPPIRTPKAAEQPKPQPTVPAPGSHSTPATPGGTSSIVEFSTHVMKLEEIGLSVLIPADCGSSKTVEPVPPELRGQAQPQTSLQILPADMSEAWTIAIRAPRVQNPAYTIEEVATNAFNLLQSKIGAGTTVAAGAAAPKLRLLERIPNAQDPRAQLMGGTERQVEFVRWYAQVPQGDGQPDVVRGLTVAKLGDTQFVTFDLTTTQKEFVKARRVYEAIIAAASLRQPEDVGAERKMAIDAGLNLMRGLNEADLKAVLTAKPERWFRLFKPSKNGRKQDDTEVGYFLYRFKEGQRGEIDRSLPKANWEAAHRERGYVILCDARLLSGSDVFDSAAGYFMRADRDAEMWIVETARRDQKAPRQSPEVFRELGVREGKQMQVESTDSAGKSQTTKPFMQDTTYLSRVEALLAPQLLIRARAQADYAYYTWISEVGKIRLRKDTLERPDGDQSRWKITTRFGDEEQAQTSYYEDSGDLIRTELVDGSIIEPSTFDELMTLWKSKGLPVESIGKKK